MPIEYAQLLSTAHRLLDGTMWIDRTANNRRIKRWRLDDDREDNLYKAGHINHPSAVWCRETTANYFHLFSLYTATLAEFTYRYGKQHGASKPWLWLQRPPKNLKRDGLTPMPEKYTLYKRIKELVDENNMLKWERDEDQYTRRVDIIGQNGNTGEHYEAVDEQNRNK